ncbi:sugar transporter-domain-containing protein [Xylaria sp. FL1042]|nr:sugar transporter-domain-containing protein [Xylaria sp. FL1042]
MVSKPVETGPPMSDFDIEMASITLPHTRSSRPDENTTWKVFTDVSDYIKLVTEANEANERERNMTLREAIKMYYMAIGWSVLASLGVIMIGYSSEVLGACFAIPSFRNKYGSVTPEGFREISQDWQKGISAAGTVGTVIGLQIASPISERFGYRWTIISLALTTMILSFIPIFSENLPAFLTGYLLQGITFGIYPVIVAYASEVCPTVLRHILIAFSFIFLVVGQFLASGVISAFSGRLDEGGYKSILMLQWIWPVPISIAMYLAPESPWWCVQKGQLDCANESLKRLARKSSQPYINGKLALMIYVDSVEKRATKGATYLDCFRGTNIRRTELVCAASVTGAICSAPLGGLTTSLYSKAGILFWVQAHVGLGVSIFALVITLTTWVILNRIGRKSLLLGGMCVIVTILLIAGFLGVPKHLSNSASIVTGSVLMVLPVVGNIITPVIYTIVAEVPSTRLRIKSIALARSAYHIINAAFVQTITEKQLDTGGWDWGLKSCLFWAGMSLIFATYIYLRLPETKGRTYAELNVMFENKIAARKFASTEVGPLRINNGNDQENLAIHIANTSAFEYQTRDIITMTT